MESYSLELKPTSEIRIYLWPITLFWIAIIYFLYQNISIHSTLKDIYLFIASVFMTDALIKLLWTFIGKFSIEINDAELITTKKFLAYTQIRRYELGKIKNTLVKYATKSGTGIGIPLSWALRGLYISYKNPIILFFEYGLSHKELGNYCEPFPAEKLLEEILKRKQLVRESYF